MSRLLTDAFVHLQCNLQNTMITVRQSQIVRTETACTVDELSAETFIISSDAPLA